VHGGGFVAGSKNEIANYMKILARQGYTMVAVEYSKGYGATYPKPVEQVNAALGSLVHNAAELKVDPATLVLAGDSAGAHIASQVTTDSAYAGAVGISPQLKANQLSAMVLVSGAFDPSAVNFEGNYGWFLKIVLWAYLGKRNFREDERFRKMSVTGHVTGTFPPSFISSGNGDPLAPQALALAQKLGQLGVRVDSLFFPAERDPALPQEYQVNLDDPAGREALSRILSFFGPVRDRAVALPHTH
jgi:acetyl esterase/lipase